MVEKKVSTFALAFENGLSGVWKKPEASGKIGIKSVKDLQESEKVSTFAKLSLDKIVQGRKARKRNENIERITIDEVVQER